MALQKPRSMAEVEQRLLDECRRPSFADSAVYELPFGKEPVSGLSIRFAEAAARALRNLLCERLVVWEDDEARWLYTCVTDLESNLTYPAQFLIHKRVERRHKRKGQTVYGERVTSTGERVFIVEPSESELLAKEGAYASRGIRNGILRILPGDIIDACWAQIEATTADRDAKDPQAARKAVAQHFFRLGVPASSIEAFIGKTIATMTDADLTKLRRIYTALKEGEASWEELVADAGGDGKPAAPRSAAAVKAALAPKEAGNA